MSQILSSQPNLLTALVSQLNDYIVLMCNTAGEIIAWHQPIQDQLGYSASDIIGKPLHELLAHDGQIASGNGSAFVPETPDVSWVVTATGQKILMSGAKLDLRDSAGNTTGFARILRSVSSDKGSEITSRALMSALDHSNVLIRRWDGVIEHWTEGCEQLYGFSAEEATGKVLHDFLHTEYPLPIDEIQNVLLAKGIWRGEVKQRHKSGKPIFVSTQLVRLEPLPGRLPLIICTNTDITSRLEMQHEVEAVNARLKGMAEELERSNEELGEFARIASHDLSAPITSTRWLVEMLTNRHSKQLDADGQRALAQVSVSLARMADLVEAVLAHAKVGTSAIASLEDADTELALEVAQENLRRDIVTSGTRVRYNRLPPLLIGQQPLTQLFQNLLSNAIKYRRPDATPEIFVSAEQRGPLWRVAVQDNGMGIEPEWFERIFLPMQRRHSSKISGSGIGLATCRKIVNRAGGRIWVESKVGSGSTFYFTLPGGAMVTPEDEVAVER